MSELVHVIDEDGQFNEKLDSIIKNWGLYEKGLDYRMCAILGVQSSGKSTILNLLFNTRFQVLNESEEGRHQVTKGIWLGYCDKNDILVFDVEGTDGRERGEEGKAFERKTSLFSLALSEIVIVNMWHHDIGRYEGANYNLFKIVFELNLQLFARNKEGKTLLLFAIRDSNKVVIEKLENAVKTDMAHIWKDIHKPAGYEKSSVTDFFDFIFVPLPHYDFQREEFQRAVGHLRDRFCDKNNKDYLWSDKYSTNIPADGLPMFAKGIWDVIQSNQDLDLPSQRKLLAEWRCGQLSREAYALFEEEVGPVAKSISSGKIAESFGDWASKLVQKAYDYYAEPASRYSQEESEREGKILKVKLIKDVHVLFKDQLTKARIESTKDFEKKLKHLIPNEEKILEDFSGNMNNIRDESVNKFLNIAKNSIITQATDWTYEDDLNELTETINKMISVEREKQMKNMINALQKRLKIQLVEPIMTLMESCSPDMWTKMRKLVSSSKNDANQYLGEKLKGFGCEESEIERRLLDMDNMLQESVQKTIKNFAENLYDFAVKKFEKLFKYDSRGIPKKWGATDNIEEVYTKAYSQVVSMISLFALLRLDDDDDKWDLSDDDTPIPPEKFILSKRQLIQITEHFKSTSDALFTQAREEQDRLNQKINIPIFMFVLLAIFAFDEIMWLIGNPFLLPLIILFGGGFGILWYMNMLYLVLPIIKSFVAVATAQLKTITDTVLDKVAQQRQSQNLNNSQDNSNKEKHE